MSVRIRQPIENAGNLRMVGPQSFFSNLQGPLKKRLCRSIFPFCREPDPAVLADFSAEIGDGPGEARLRISGEVDVGEFTGAAQQDR